MSARNLDQHALPQAIVAQLPDALVFADHPLGMPIVGTSESITAASPATPIRR
mgnify:CR=1 FL=1